MPVPEKNLIRRATRVPLTSTKVVTMPIVHDSPTMNVRDECGRTMVAVIVTLKGINVALTRRLPKTAYQSGNRRGQIY